MPRVWLNWEKHKQEIQLRFNAYSQTKKHFAILYFIVSVNVSEQSFSC